MKKQNNEQSTQIQDLFWDPCSTCAKCGTVKCVEEWSNNGCCRNYIPEDELFDSIQQSRDFKSEEI